MSNLPEKQTNFDILQELTAARLGLMRAGSSVATREVLKFDLDHARARDAVHLPFDTAAFEEELKKRELEFLSVQSAAKDRTTYLQRPDLGRKLSEESRQELQNYTMGNAISADICIVIADGLSSKAIDANAINFLDEFLPLLPRNNWSLAPLVVAKQGRVALADEVGEVLNVRLSIILIGERPGLTAADSMGIYFTYEPKTGKTDADKNCISNVREGGLSLKEAALKLENLIQSSFKLCLSGVGLKDSDPLIIDKESDKG